MLFENGGSPGDEFGTSVAIDGDTLVIGAQWDVGNNTQGSASVYVRSGGVWILQAKLDGGFSSSIAFGWAVAISGNTIAVADDYTRTVHIFTRSGTAWSRQATIVVPANYFGESLGLSGDTLLVGTYGASAYVFTRTGTVWTQQAILLAFDAVSGDMFGNSVSLAATPPSSVRTPTMLARWSIKGLHTSLCGPVARGPCSRS